MKKLCAVIIIIAGAVFFPSRARAQDAGLPLLAETQYFHLYGYQGIDISEILARLNFSYFLHLDMLVGDGQPRDAAGILSRTADALYLQTSDILGIHIYSFHGRIVFFPDRSSLSNFFKEKYRTEFNEPSGYVFDKNTIYVSFPDLTLGMLGHEIAHAVLSHYFVVPPPARVQEILCGYVEYTLSQSAGKLPQ